MLVAAAPMGLTAGVINWGDHPQGVAWPGIILTVVDDIEETTLDGPSGLSSARVQIDCWAPTYAGAAAIGEAVRDLLNGAATERIQGVFLISSRRGRDLTAPDRPFRASMDFQIVWNRS